ncbi:MAG: hypothetical protein P4L22_02765 [Candidatus Babeliales bacterium]|nr:hypothetical protein [Candidatus Babeliales bacterium]
MIKKLLFFVFLGVNSINSMDYQHPYKEVFQQMPNYQFKLDAARPLNIDTQPYAHVFGQNEHPYANVFTNDDQPYAVIFKNTSKKRNNSEIGDTAVQAENLHFRDEDRFDLNEQKEEINELDSPLDIPNMHVNTITLNSNIRPKMAFICNVCLKDCKYRKVLLNHIARYHTSPPESEAATTPYDDTIEIDKLFACNFRYEDGIKCKKKFEKKRSLYYHSLNHPIPGESYICPITKTDGKKCLKILKSRKQLADHKRKPH